MKNPSGESAGAAVVADDRRVVGDALQKRRQPKKPRTGRPAVGAGRAEFRAVDRQFQRTARRPRAEREKQRGHLGHVDLREVEFHRGVFRRGHDRPRELHKAVGLARRRDLLLHGGDGRGVCLGVQRVVVAFERGVELVRQVVEVGHLDEVRFFPRGKRVVCSPFHSNLLKNSKNKTPGKPGVHACQA